MARESIAVRALLVSRDIGAVEFLCAQLQEFAIYAQVACDVESGTRKLCHEKFEAVVIDLALGESATALLEKLRELTSHRHAISFALCDSKKQSFGTSNAHANFVLPRPLVASIVKNTLRAAYPLMFRERRRDYRYPIEISTWVKIDTGSEFTTTSLNISETGIALSSTELAAAIEVGRQLRLRMELPRLPEPLTARGEVCWKDANGRLGIRFTTVAAALTERLQLWLSERMSELVPRS